MTPNSNIKGHTKKKTTKTIRVDIEDWLYVYKMVGDEQPMKEGVHELIETHKEVESIDIDEL